MTLADLKSSLAGAEMSVDDHIQTVGLRFPCLFILGCAYCDPHRSSAEHVPLRKQFADDPYPRLLFQVPRLSVSTFRQAGPALTGKICEFCVRPYQDAYHVLAEQNQLDDSSVGIPRAQPNPISKDRYSLASCLPNDPRSASARHRFADTPRSTPS